MRDDTLLRMRATDAGFDRSLPPQGTWLAFTAAGNLATVWIGGDGVTHLVAAAPAAVATEVGDVVGVAPWSEALPAGATAGWSCLGDKALDALCPGMCCPISRCAAWIWPSRPPSCQREASGLLNASPRSGSVSGRTSFGTP